MRLSQTQLAQEIGAGQTTVSEWEIGAREPQPEMVKKLSIALNVPTAEILPPRLQGLAEEPPELAPDDEPDVAFGRFAAAFVRTMHTEVSPDLPMALLLTQARRIWRFAGASDTTLPDFEMLRSATDMLVDGMREVRRDRTGD